MAHLTGTPRAKYVHHMFGRIAARYDLLNGLMSLGRDRHWRREAALLAAPDPGSAALDLATGTGALAMELARSGAASVVGVDFSAPMLAQGRRRVAAAGMAGRVQLMLGDAHALPFPDGAFSCATVAFGVRNFADPLRAMTELRRVVQPGGRVVTLELLRPDRGPAATIYRMYLHRMAPLIDRCLGGDGEAYHYLGSSVQTFLTPDQFQGMMEAAGFRNVTYYSFHLGVIAVHLALR
ncbi:MAG: ubiquinone/menaquinone biosynthesis methyltransferase [Chloroflexi bacterium]|nr:ubiquinone/menaquinone biosynthesis methyltransferase [Chloroflexota bacterium]